MASNNNVSRKTILKEIFHLENAFHIPTSFMKNPNEDRTSIVVFNPNGAEKGFVYLMSGESHNQLLDKIELVKAIKENWSIEDVPVNIRNDGSKLNDWMFYDMYKDLNSSRMGSQNRDLTEQERKQQLKIYKLFSLMEEALMAVRHPTEEVQCYPEGRRVKKTVTTILRDRRNRDLAFQYYPHKCWICYYTPFERMREFIKDVRTTDGLDCHHAYPARKLDDERPIIEELKILCPDCHSWTEYLYRHKKNLSDREEWLDFFLGDVVNIIRKAKGIQEQQIIDDDD